MAPSQLLNRTERGRRVAQSATEGTAFTHGSVTHLIPPPLCKRTTNSVKAVESLFQRRLGMTAPPRGLLDKVNVRSKEDNLPSCWVDLKGLKDLYRRLQAHNLIACDATLDRMVRPEGQSEQDFTRDKDEIGKLFSTEFIVVGTDG